MQALLNGVREHYQFVLIDTPPLLPVTDAAAIAPATDGVLFVLSLPETKRPQVGTAITALKAVQTPVLGTVLTMVPSSGPPTHSGYGSHHADSSLRSLRANLRSRLPRRHLPRPPGTRHPTGSRWVRPTATSGHRGRLGRRGAPAKSARAESRRSGMTFDQAR